MVAPQRRSGPAADLDSVVFIAFPHAYCAKQFKHQAAFASTDEFLGGKPAKLGNGIAAIPTKHGRPIVFERLCRTHHSGFNPRTARGACRNDGTVVVRIGLALKDGHAGTSVRNVKVGR
jgi:hypothetical protein